MDETPLAPQNALSALPMLPSASTLLKQAFSFYLAHWKTFLGIIAVPILLDIIHLFIPSPAINLLWTLVGSVTSFAILITIIENGEPKDGILGVYHRGITMILLAIWIEILIICVVLGGFVLLIIPGIIIGILVSQSLFVLFVDQRRGIGALTLSWHYVKGYAGAVLWRGIFLGIVWIPLIILTAIIGKSLLLQTPLLILSDLLIPLNLIYGYLIFTALKIAKAEVPFETEEKSIRKKIIGFSILGIVGMILLLLLFGFIAALIFTSKIKFQPQPQTVNNSNGVYTTSSTNPVVPLGQ